MTGTLNRDQSALTGFFSVATDKAEQRTRAAAEAAAQRQCERQQHEAAKAERLAPLEEACRTSRFTAITEALAELPANWGKKFFVDKTVSSDGTLVINISLDFALRQFNRPVEGNGVTKQNVISFSLTAPNKITCTRGDHVVKNAATIAHERARLCADRGMVVTVPPCPAEKYEHETIQYKNMKCAVQEQLTDWLAAVAPERVKELQDKMAIEGVPTTPEKAGRIRSHLRKMRAGVQHV